MDQAAFEDLASRLQAETDASAFSDLFTRLSALAGYRAWAVGEMRRTGEGGHTLEILASSSPDTRKGGYADDPGDRFFRLISRTWRAKTPMTWRIVADADLREASCVRLHGHMGGVDGEEMAVVPFDVVDPSRRGFGFALAAPGGGCLDDMSRSMQLFSAFLARCRSDANLPPRIDLSRREIAVLQNCALGMKSDAIAAAEGISPHTVKDYLERARVKLEARTLPHAVALAMRAKLIR
jgi:DNA-binding CsgD family transcriptional regulator